MLTVRFTFSLLLPQVLAIFLLCADATAATPPIGVTSSDVAFSDAMEQYEQGRWSAAYGRFVALADQGHAEAARIALLMLRHGAKMYGHDWSASQPQINEWMKLALQRMKTLESESGD
jgi:hypothetical protein